MEDPRASANVTAQTLRNPHVLDMFNSVVGGETGENWSLPVIYRKLAPMAGDAKRFVQVIEVLAAEGSPLGAFPDALAEAGQYAAALRAQLKALPPAPDLAPFLVPACRRGGGSVAAALQVVAEVGDPALFENVPAGVAKQFGRAYLELKASGPVGAALKACAALSRYRGVLGDEKKLKDRFLRESPTISFTPLQDLRRLDFRLIYNSPKVSPAGRQTLLLALHKLYTVGYALYERVMAADVDIADFVRTVTESIEKLRQKIPRCDAAFDKILDSVELLRSNFDTYHSSFVISGSPATIMTDFVQDVAKRSSASAPRIAIQFRKIIAHYRKEATGGKQAGDRRMREVFKAINANLSVVESEAGGGGPPEGDEAPAGADPAPGAELADPAPGAGLADPAPGAELKAGPAPDAELKAGPAPDAELKAGPGDAKRAVSPKTLRYRQKKKARAAEKRRAGLAGGSGPEPAGAGPAADPGGGDLRSPSPPASPEASPAGAAGGAPLAQAGIRVAAP